MSSLDQLDREIEKLVRTYGFVEIVGWVCRWCHVNGFRGAFTKLNRVYTLLRVTV